ncbi:MAG: lysophospholipid acyltransferase family protein [Bacteroidetes bacterium]|nr:lysophospholipid acyltransferase family protein [Bacteroidota bacterium]MCY4234623.1 lysophospholipid acyltransferase family protein [Bacteroidota bacterium]
MSFPVLGYNIPRKAKPRMMRFARWALTRLNWEIQGTLPDHKQFVVIGAYHTSNWDFFVAMGVMFALDLEGSWVAKHTIFRWPLGVFMRACGGNPIDRKQHGGHVQRAIQLFEDNEKFVYAITPEGTRSKVERWKTGFYHIACGAGVVIVPAYFDYPNRRVGFGSPLTPTGDLEHDIAVLQRFYEPYKETAARPDRV